MRLGEMDPAQVGNYDEGPLPRVAVALLQTRLTLRRRPAVRSRLGAGGTFHCLQHRDGRNGIAHQARFGGAQARSRTPVALPVAQK